MIDYFIDRASYLDKKVLIPIKYNYNFINYFKLDKKETSVYSQGGGNVYFDLKELIFKEKSFES